MVLRDKENTLIGSILVLCTQNAVRSPILESLLKQAFGNRVYISSAGVTGSKVNPFVIEVMKESGIDLTHYNSRAYTELPQTSYDLVIALSHPAYDLAREIGKNQVLDIEYWSVPEPPAEPQGNRGQILDTYRRIRDDLYLHMKNRFDM